MAKNYWNLNLLTLNGPNKFDEYPSGSDVFSLGGPWDLHVWPTRKRDARHPKWVPETGLLESLRFRGLANETSAEGTQFILGYRAGQTAYPGPVDDPMFGAHTYRGENRYWPDYEMTAMQCIEQYRVSDHRKSSGPTATPWMSQYDIYSDDFWTNNGLLSSFIDNRGLLTLMMTYPSVYDHLYQKQGVQALLAAMHKDESIIYGIDDQEQWIREMKAWMEIGIIKARYTFLQMVAGHTDGDRETSSLVAIGNYSDYRDGATICDHVLIRDPDSTDIDAVGIWCFLGLQLIIILCSYLGAARRGVCTMYARFCQPRRNRVVFYEEEGRSTRHSSPPPRQSLGGDTLVPSAMASSLEVAGDEGSRPRFSTDSNRTLVQRNSDIDIQRSGMPCEVPECQCGVKGKGKAKETVESADGGEASGSFDG
jgi:hypothetical protein